MQTDTLDIIRADSEFCSDHLHNTLSESKACKRATLLDAAPAILTENDKITEPTPKVDGIQKA